MAIGKDVMKREIIEEHKNQGYRLRDNRLHMQQMADSKLDHKGKDIATNSGDLETHTTRNPRSLVSREMTEGKKIIWHKVCHD